MSDTKIRSSKLTFKGDDSKKSKKRKRKELREDADEEAGDPQAWVNPTLPTQVLGPTFIVHPSEPPLSISYDTARAKISLHAISIEPGTKVSDLEPTEVSQVWVVTRIAGSPTINLRTADGKFMSSDQYGVVSSGREARGPQEEWTPVILPEGMVAFQNMYEKYLAVDEVAGGTLSLRGDSEEVGFAERFYVKIQEEYRRKAGEEERKKKEVDTMGRIDEAGTNKKFQTWGMARSVVSEADRTDLKKARKEGRLTEALLDRRSKLKADRFC